MEDPFFGVLKESLQLGLKFVLFLSLIKLWLLVGGKKKKKTFEFQCLDFTLTLFY